MLGSMQREGRTDFFSAGNVVRFPVDKEDEVGVDGFVEDDFGIPQLFGPINTVGCSSSMCCISPKRLKFSIST
ncbi:MAG: hypothetical protein LBK99_14885 [Opitutaceae bacterium]|nr:hypothetical protein [Opitutaceae bacterium]